MNQSYTIAWKECLPDVDLDGVEYQSLPSGLHSVPSDLVYFTRGRFAGVSAFAQGEADLQHRNARFAAVGILSSLSYGRLGRSWLHAESLQRLASVIVRAPDDRRPLELFWEQARAKNGDEAVPPGSRRGDGQSRRERAFSNGSTLFNSEGQISPNHPALAFPEMLDLFGPLVFPLHRAALLRKRVLFLGRPPVQRQCDYGEHTHAPRLSLCPL